MAGGASSSQSWEFQWGERVKDSETSYECMCFKGIWYSLYDCVRVRSDTEEPHIGKLMRLYEEHGARKIRVRWFLRPSELPASVSKDLSGRNKKELFIAQGGVTGVENVNLVETIVGKTTVLCTARSPKNLQPSQRHMDEAHHVFSKVYDAKMRKLVKIEQFERVEKTLASKFFNKPEWLVPPIAENATYEVLRSPTSVKDFEMAAANNLLSPNARGSCCLEKVQFKTFKGGP